MEQGTNKSTSAISEYNLPRGRKELSLPEHQPVSLKGDYRGRQIRSLAGSLWVSQAGDPVDHIINPGERFIITRRGQVVVEGFGDSRALIS
jgi:Protein of unknown function (DUF2917)